MVLLKSENLQLGQKMPSFNLASVDGRQVSAESLADKKVLVILFICSHCPYVQAIEDRYVGLYQEVKSQGVEFIGICSNDPTDYPEDRPENLFKRWKEKKYEFPYLIDAAQEIARRFGAVCTPDLYVYDQARTLRYHGRLDDNWKDPAGVQKQDLKQAIEFLLKGRVPPAEQVPSMGCSIKWKSK